MFPGFDFGNAPTVGEKKNKRANKRSDSRAGSTRESTKSSRAGGHSPSASHSTASVTKQPTSQLHQTGNRLSVREDVPHSKSPATVRNASKNGHQSSDSSVTLRLDYKDPTQDQIEPCAVKPTQRLPKRRSPPPAPPVLQSKPSVDVFNLWWEEDFRDELSPLSSQPTAKVSDLPTWSEWESKKEDVAIPGAPVAPAAAEYTEYSSGNGSDITRLGRKSKSSNQDVMRDVSRSKTRQRKAEVSYSTFCQNLQNMVAAQPAEVSAQLQRTWRLSYLDQDDAQFCEFELHKRLWALSAYERFVIKQSQSLGSEHSSTKSDTRQMRKILHLDSDIAAGWLLAARNPTCIVYTIISQDSEFLVPACEFPPNHHMVHISLATSYLPFPNEHFDSVVSHALMSTVYSKDLCRFLQDCHRVMKPGAHLEILSIDPELLDLGPLALSWLHNNVLSPMSLEGYSTTPAETVRESLALAGFKSSPCVRISLPIIPPRIKDADDAMKMASMTAILGQYLYTHAFRSWATSTEDLSQLWNDKSMGPECEAHGSRVSIAVTVARKSQGKPEKAPVARSLKACVDEGGVHSAQVPS